MARFYGEVGYGATAETAPGVWDDVITERKYRGDVVRDTRRYSEGDSINDDLSLSNSVSIVADDYAVQNLYAIRYVKVSGVLWKVQSFEIQRPRILLRLGGVYNGPKAPTPSSP